jgi:hypothetical protein
MDIRRLGSAGNRVSQTDKPTMEPRKSSWFVQARR